MGLVAQWRLNEQRGVIAFDNIGSSDGTWDSGELVTGGNMSDATKWTAVPTDTSPPASDGWAIGAGVAVRSAGETISSSIRQVLSGAVAGREYLTSYDVDAIGGAASAVKIELGGIGSSGTGDTVTGTGTASQSLVASGTTLFLTATTNTTCTLDDVSVKQNILSDSRGIIFNGTDEKIDLAYDNIGTTLTYSMWFKRTGSGNTDLLSFMDTLIRVSDSLITWWPKVDGGSAQVSYTFSSNDAWHHLAITQTGTDAKMYLDGVLVASNASATGVNTADATNMIGNWNSTYFGGSISDVRLYDDVLTAGQVRDLYFGTNRFGRILRRTRRGITL